MNTSKYLSLILLPAILMATGCNKDCQENEKSDCICTMEYDPVCGCNGKTYGNDCEAKCHGIESYTKGACD